MFFTLISESTQTMFRSKSHYIIIYRLPLPSALCSNTKKHLSLSMHSDPSKQYYRTKQLQYNRSLKGRSEVLAAVSLTIHVFWDVISCDIGRVALDAHKHFSAFTFKRQALKSLPLEDAGNTIPQNVRNRNTLPITMHHIPKDLNPWEHSTFMCTYL